MRIAGLALLMAVAAGCRGLWPHETQFCSDVAPCATPAEASAATAPCPTPASAPSPSCAPPSQGAVCQTPQTEVKPCEEIHVKAPPQRVVVRRRAAPAAEQVQQQTVTTQDVILVRQPVLVPYVRSTTFGNVALSGVQQTQVINAVGVNAAAGGTLADLSGVTQLATGGGAATGQFNAQVETLRAQNERQLTENKALERRLADYERQYEQLSQRLEEVLKQLPPPATPKSTVPRAP